MVNLSLLAHIIFVQLSVTYPAVIDNKVRDWLHDPRMKDYLRPITLFSQSKFKVI
ncbi:conserved phage C-terminal domain-containing protein [Paenibacillus septentrionalis]|uniref:Conserved phage C-terminal domain-containing protein n=1 Tax=Paenibacillus septentrionalis TaxID=429342 RepID=A0ABW1V2M0_9BACL